MLGLNSIFIKILALFITVLLFPLLILIGAAVFFSTGEFPVFSQKRALTLEHKSFTIYKYRTIKQHNAQTPSNSVLYKPGIQGYVTGLGSFLRKTGFDEILQLINILKGDMSFIGPRPLSLDDILIIKRDYPDLYSSRAEIKIKPGITGLWQVSGRRELGIANLINNDIYYAKNRSLKLNLKIIGLTIKTILTRTHSDSVLNVYGNLFSKKIKNHNWIIQNFSDKKG